MLNIHSWTKDQLHSSEVHSIEEASCYKSEHIKMLNIHSNKRSAAQSSRCIVLRRPVSWQEDTKNVEYPLFGPKDQLHSSEVHKLAARARDT
jgi:hypothetical protein